VEQRLLAGTEGSEARIEIKRAGGERGEFRARRTMPRMDVAKRVRSTSELPVYGLLPGGVGYVDLVRLTYPMIESAFATVRDASALILDQRGYVMGGTFGLAAMIDPRLPTAAQFRMPLLLHPGPGGTSSRSWEQRTGFGAEPTDAKGYSGRVVILIDEQAISSGEHSCLHHEVAARSVTFVGSPTNGTNGTVSWIPLPGGVWVRFTGLDVRHADGRRLQRLGIQPDIHAAPTVAGIRAGRDEVLAAALEHLQKTRGE
jgi:C-terminal processing protease CtpA/Prc